MKAVFRYRHWSVYVKGFSQIHITNKPYQTGVSLFTEDRLLEEIVGDVAVASGYLFEGNLRDLAFVVRNRKVKSIVEKLLSNSKMLRLADYKVLENT